MRGVWQIRTISLIAKPQKHLLRNAAFNDFSGWQLTTLFAPLRIDVFEVFVKDVLPQIAKKLQISYHVNQCNKSC